MRLDRRAWYWLAGLAVVAFGAGKLFGRVLARQVIRRDAAGDGRYGATRRGHVHEGVDLVASPGENVTAPFDGLYLRTGRPYEHDDRFTMAVLRGDNREVRLMYVSPVVQAGAFVKKGDVIGTAQDVTLRYPGSGMLPHVHVEVRDPATGKAIDPTPLLRFDA